MTLLRAPIVFNREKKCADRHAEESQEKTFAN
jgi:hypothetical protein